MLPGWCAQQWYRWWISDQISARFLAGQNTMKNTYCVQFFCVPQEFFFVNSFPRTMATHLCFLLLLNYCRYIVRVCCKVRICNPQSSGLYGCEELETAFGFPCKIKSYYDKMKVCAMSKHIGLGSLAVNFSHSGPGYGILVYNKGFCH